MQLGDVPGHPLVPRTNRYDEQLHFKSTSFQTAIAHEKVGFSERIVVDYH
jgi:hypothetical protein